MLFTYIWAHTCKNTVKFMFAFVFFFLRTAREQKSQKCSCSTYHNQKEKQQPYFIIVLPGIMKLNAEFRHDVDQTTLVCITTSLDVVKF